MILYILIRSPIHRIGRMIISLAERRRNKGTMLDGSKKDAQEALATWAPVEI